ncbi:ABC transporter ATP-binding protein [Phaeobacter sp. HF9A]|uniref:ABC transporter ATP-binding protein n=1 Tax=Phaeobacter sp. HF9A TaxID=2721561 RepID=UPI001431C9B3|nr:ABC transporter ATP-binding protein [Phaeobacter sp. HF9A]NIZ13075.1 ABC transporter ATP-binding protein [Phaeobacter sp. HF9A]
MTSAIGLSGLQKTYPGAPPVRALRNADLAINDNEFFTLLGPSGCGKTTLLRLMAGFEVPTGGKLTLFGEDIAHLPPEKRPINTVFQHYSLFPHMTVLENVAFGLKRLHKSDAEAKQVAQQMLDLVHLADFGDRKPGQLSGGQQQRVALARALAPQPRVLLLDEPLSALDLKLRQSMRAELKRLQRETGITFVFVTHDQEEALAMSDRIAVMSQGEIQQVGDPATIYEFPENRFVAEFIGDADFFEAEVLGGTEYKLSNGALLTGPRTEAAIGSQVTLFFRPEKAELKQSGSGLPGQVSEILYLGNSTDYVVDLAQGGALTVRSENHKDGTALADVGADVVVEIDPAAVRVVTT